MTTISRGIRIDESLDREIAREAERSGVSRSAAAAGLLEEAIRLRRAPGIAFADGPTGRRAVVAGTGLDVWEVVAAWQAVGRDFNQLRREFDWLSAMQLRAALGYYELYPKEIQSRLEREEAWTPERVARELPFAKTRP